MTEPGLGQGRPCGNPSESRALSRSPGKTRVAPTTSAGSLAQPEGLHLAGVLRLQELVPGLRGERLEVVG